MTRIGNVGLCCAILAAALAASSARAAGDLQQGRQILEASCGGCHAIDAQDNSSHPDAPAFRTLSARYPVRDLEEALGEGIITGHPDMPEFVLEADQIEDVIAYLESIQQ